MIGQSEMDRSETCSQKIGIQVSKAKVRASSCSRASTDDSKSNELSGVKKTAKANVTFIKVGNWKQELLKYTGHVLLHLPSIKNRTSLEKRRFS